MNGATSTATYDGAGNLTSLTNPLGAMSKYAYDLNGKVTAAINPLGVVTKYSYDPLGHLTQIIQGATSGASPGSTSTNVATSYGYTATGQLASTTDANSHTTTYGYDPRGLHTSTTNPLGIVSRTTYDALGRATAATDGNGQTTNTSYTARSDVASVAYPDGARTSFEYDTDQHPIVMTDSLGTTGFTYDPAGQQLTQTDPNGVTVKTGYDAAGNTVSQAIGGQKLAYSFDPAGRMSTETTPWGSLAYAYDQVGNLTTESRSTGVTSTYGYDAAGEVTSIVHQTPKTGALPTSAAATVAKWDGSQAIAGDAPVCSAKNPVAGYLANRTVPGTAVSGCEQTSTYLAGAQLPTLAAPLKPGQALSYGYTYDAAGNVTNQTQTTGTKAVSTGYSYDNLDRLTASAATDGPTNAYAYDSVGNRTGWVTSKAPDTGKKLTVTAVFDAANELTSETRARPTGKTNLVYSYDAAGNRTRQSTSGASRSTTTYAYTGAGQLRSVTKGQASTSYGYDGMGRNLTSTVKGSAGTQKTTSVYDGLDVVQQTNSATGTSTLVRDALGQVAIQSHTAGGTSDGAAWNLQDRAGSSVAQTNPTGAVTDVVNYSDFGVPKFTTTGWAGATGYTGEQTDPTSGLNLYYARAYDPMAGTWLSSDPTSGTLTDPMSQNHYGYAGANPTTNKDLLGYLSIRNLIDTRGAESSFSAVAPKANPFLVQTPKPKKGAATIKGATCKGSTAACSSKTTPRHAGNIPAPYNGWNVAQFAKSAALAVIEAGKIVKTLPKPIRALTRVGADLSRPFGPVGLALGGLNAVSDWDQNNAWGNTRNLVGVGLSLVEQVAPLGGEVGGAVAVLAATVGIAWDLMDAIWDTGDAYWWNKK